jgi:hypothetical protein
MHSKEEKRITKHLVTKGLNKERATSRTPRKTKKACHQSSKEKTKLAYNQLPGEGDEVANWKPDPTY